MGSFYGKQNLRFGLVYNNKIDQNEVRNNFVNFRFFETTVKLCDKERFDKEQTGVKEQF